MTGVEIDLVVHDSRAALKFYQTVFGAEIVEVTDYDRGLNEAVFTIFGTRFHLLDENPQYQLIAPTPEDRHPFWINVMVEDIKGTIEAARKENITMIQDITGMPEMGLSNAIFLDPFGHLWMVHEIHEEKSFEERTAYLEKNMSKADQGKE